MTGKQVIFRRGVWWLGAFLALVTVQLVAGVLVSNVWSLGPEIPVLESNALARLLDLVLLGGTWWFVRMEGVDLGDLGLSRTLVGPAVVAIATFYLALNVAGIGLALLVAGPEVVGYQWSVPPTRAVLEFVYVLVFAGIVEELAFRGYLQSKVVAIVGGDTRVGIGVGIAIAAALFVASHVPRVLSSGVPGTQAVAEYGGILFLSGLAFGILYELTQNLYVPILVHAAGDMPGTIGIVFIDVSAFPPWAGTAYVVVYLALFGILIVGYRRWAFEAGTLPVWTTRDAISGPPG